jgi:TetR/AcrR family transcriptional repressor of mexJK operon
MAITEAAPQAETAADEKLEAIVEAARKTFLAKGYDSASMDQIALTAGVSKRTVYNRFRSKEELFGAAIEDTCKKLVPVNIAEIEASLSPVEVVRSLSLKFVTGILRPEAICLRRIAAFEAERTPALGKNYIEHGPQWMVEQCAPILERQIARGAFIIDDAEAALWRLGALITEPLYTFVLMGVTPENIDQAISDQVNSGVEAFVKLYGATQ